MNLRKHQMIVLLLFGVFITTIRQTYAQDPHSPTVKVAVELKMYGVKISVSDIDKALAFYHDIMGFEVLSMANYPRSVPLKNDGIALFLSKTHRSAQIDYTRVEQVGLAFQVNDLLQTMKDLKSKGVEFLNDTPNKNGVGIDAKFKDPFGNIHSFLEQQIVKTPLFEEPRIYNVGFSLMDVKTAREFYCEKLGFVVRTEKYFPPALPLGHHDGTFGFMLHEDKKRKKAQQDYENDSQTIIVYETKDLDATIKKLKARGVQFIHETPQSSPQGRLIAFLNPAGIASEIVEREASHRDNK